ncbi:rRNA maturation RNase YbeY [Candidatus Phytoplasma phoenicium]|uniref:Endoribonuclease YbeY n=1 Tax=Candidatus Phytoplasma phoenicium TaxID=198422 RepID=A0A2S8NVI5_9MOLU|nr:rRNA maturation RNase YbeY [Candidatus Phytoplasma phoenicium]
MIIKIHNHTHKNILYLKKILLSIFTPLKESKIFHLIFISNEKIQQMNYYYCHKNFPTDVLTFVNDIEDDESLGDVFISLPKAYEQAFLYGHSIDREVAFLALHGYFHLKGYTHDTEHELQAMLQLQEQILKKHNLSIKQSF